MKALQQHDWPGNVRELENVDRAGDDPHDRRHAACSTSRFGRVQQQTADERRSATRWTSSSGRTSSRIAASSAAGGSTAGQRRRAARPPSQHAPLPDEEARRRLPRSARRTAVARAEQRTGLTSMNHLRRLLGLRQVLVVAADAPGEHQPGNDEHARSPPRTRAAARRRPSCRRRPAAPTARRPCARRTSRSPAWR